MLWGSIFLALQVIFTHSNIHNSLRSHLYCRSVPLCISKCRAGLQRRPLRENALIGSLILPTDLKKTWPFRGAQRHGIFLGWMISCACDKHGTGTRGLFVSFPHYIPLHRLQGRVSNTLDCRCLLSISGNHLG